MPDPRPPLGTKPAPLGVNVTEPRDREPSARTWFVWLTILVIASAAMFLVRPQLEKVHVALAFLIVVLGGSAAGGRILGLTLSILGFFAFNFFFIPPYYSLGINDQLDWLVLAAYLTTGVVGAQLLNRSQERADIARQRAVEVERLAALGSETLNAGRAEDALVGIAEVIRSAIGVACCEVLVPRGAPPELVTLTHTGECTDGVDTAGAPDENTAWSLSAWVAEKHAIAAERADGTKWIGTDDSPEDVLQWPPPDMAIRTLLVPLTVRDRTVGVLRISHREPFTLDPSREQFLIALSYYAALGAERVELVAEAERADAFRQADTLKSALIAGLSHDLRTPLTTIKAIAASLRARGSAEAATIEEEADRLNRLVADLLDLSRLNAGAMPIRPELNAAEDLIGAAIRQVSGVLGARRVVVTNPALGDGKGSASVLVGRFDFVQALRALVNLIENADKYSPNGEPIELGVERHGAELRFSVGDRGPGVLPAERERIFEPFYRAPGAAPDVGGAGLGLAIARRLAMEQGGDVQYEPRSGGGSRFTLVLPAADGPPV
jgi:two-component system sensor histidine kinase KdpD